MPRAVRNNLWNIITILSFVPIIKSHSDVLGVKNNKSCENSGHDADITNFLHKGDDFKIQFDYNEYYLNFSSDQISVACQSSIQILENRAKLFDLNALKMLDANPKISSGVLRGSINSLGDFDECLEVNIDEFQGKYCLAEIHFEVHAYLRHFKNLIMANEPYKNVLNDIDHILPKTSTNQWAICMPSTCSYRDLEIALRNTLEAKFGKYLSSYQVRVKERNCQIRDESSWTNVSFGTKIAILLFSILLILTCTGTIYDVCSVGVNRNEVLLAFSLIKNLKETISTDISPREIPSLNGIRFINTLMIILGHKTMVTFFRPMVNKGSVGELYESYASIPYRAMFLYTEVFLMLSGLLLTYSLVGRLNRGQNISIKKEIAARYFRFMPPVIALMLISAFILPMLGSGPLWPDVILSQRDLCKTYGWRNIFMIQNWFGFEYICNFNLHHVGTDFVIFIASLPIIIYLHKNNRYNTMIIASLGILSTIGRFYVTYTNSNIVIYVRSRSTAQQMMDTGNFMYGIPPYRFTSYSIGILMGYILRNQKVHPIEQKFLNFGWLLAILSFALICISTVTVHLTYTPLNMAVFSAFTPILFCAFFAWIIYVSQNQCGNKFTKFFEWKYFKITSTISYATYLIQFQIFHYNVGITRGPMFYTIYSQMFDFNEVLLIFVAAFMMTLLVELPFNNIKKIIFDKEKTIVSCPVKND